MTVTSEPLAKERIRVKAGYDSDQEYLLEGEEMGHTVAHEFVIVYLYLVLTRLYASQNVGVVLDVELSLPANSELEKESKGIYKCPDISAIEGVVASETNPLGRYEIGLNHPPPLMAFEIASGETWPIDLNKKPDIYAKMGITEYFTFDPLGVWTREWRKKGPLLGWRLNPHTHQPLEIVPAADGRLWSEELNSWFGVQPDKTLRLFDAENNMRLTPEQYQAEQASQREQELETQIEQASQREQELEAQKRLTQTQAQELEVQAEKIRRLLARLRESGQNPDDI